MFYKNIILFALLLLSIPSYSQTKQDSTVRHRKNALIFAPLNLLDIINPSFQIGYQRKIGTNKELQLEGGYIINKSLMHYTINPNESREDFTNRGYKVRLEFKRYIHQEKGFRAYLSAEVFHMENTSEVINQFIVSDYSYDYSFDLPPNEGRIVYTDYFTNEKVKTGFNIKFGYKVGYLNKYFLESYIGTGVSYRENKHRDRENIKDPSYDESPWNDNLLGGRWLISLPFNIKMGWHF